MRIGEITLRLGTDDEKGIYYNSNIGYGIDKQYRGNGFAVRACKIVQKLALIEGIKELTITCNIYNKPSIRVIEKLGAEFIETVDVPSEFLDEYDIIPKRLRYRLKI